MVPHAAPVLSLAHPPSPRAQEVLARVRALLDELAPQLPAQPDPFSLDLDLKRRVQEASAAAGLYCPHLRAPDGLGLSLVEMFWVQHEVYRRGIGGGQWMLAWTDGPSPLVSAWSEEARATVLPAFLAGTTTVAFALTEPGVGSDFPSLTTTARRDGSGGYVLDGEKHLITGAPSAEFAQVFARLEGAARGELTAVLVPLGAPGVTRGPVQQTIMGDGLTGSLRFDGVRVPASMLLGEEGTAIGLAFRWINWARSRRGGMCVGLARHCLERAVEYAHERESFGKPIAEHGAVGGMLANMAMDVEAMQALSLELLARLDRNPGFLDGGPVSAADRRDLSMLKTWCDEALYRVADTAIQVFGGRGLLTETGIERIFRVARNLRIPAGTTEIQRDLIARAL